MDAKDIEKLVEHIEPLKIFQCEVDDIVGDSASVKFYQPDGTHYWRNFPKERLASAKNIDDDKTADHVGAEFVYAIYGIGAYRISTIRYFVPSVEQLIVRNIGTLSEEDLAELDRVD